jgi:hypothetical protein
VSGDKKVVAQLLGAKATVDATNKVRPLPQQIAIGAACLWKDMQYFRATRAVLKSNTCSTLGQHMQYFRATHAVL